MCCQIAVGVCGTRGEEGQGESGGGGVDHEWVDGHESDGENGRSIDDAAEDGSTPAKDRHDPRLPTPEEAENTDTCTKRVGSCPRERQHSIVEAGARRRWHGAHELAKLRLAVDRLLLLDLAALPGDHVARRSCPTIACP